MRWCLSLHFFTYRDMFEWTREPGFFHYGWGKIVHCVSFFGEEIVMPYMNAFPPGKSMRQIIALMIRTQTWPLNTKTFLVSSVRFFLQACCVTNRECCYTCMLSVTLLKFAQKYGPHLVKGSLVEWRFESPHCVEKRHFTRIKFTLPCKRSSRPDPSHASSSSTEDRKRRLRNAQRWYEKKKLVQDSFSSSL